jgi:ubiquinone biosynthesis protein
MIRANNERSLRLVAPIGRFAEICLLVAFHGAWFAASGARLLLLRRRSECGAMFGERLATLCEALGPTFVKAGQILSSRPDLLPVEIVAALVRLQDRLAPFDGARIPRIIEEAFGRPSDELFDSFDLHPVAAASIAQVHRARLKDGREVAVKIRRPGIHRRVEGDLRILDWTARVLSRLPWMCTVPLAELLDEIGRPIRQQLDFHLEAENNRRFREHFANTEHIKIPALVEHLCAKNVLTMEYVEGMQRIDSTNFNAQERKTAALAGLRALYKMIFSDGLIHADMHPGNVFIREWGEFVILDTGLVARLNEQDQQDFVNFFFGLANNQGGECARIIYENASFRAQSCDRQAFEQAMVELIARHSALKSHEFEVSLFVYQLIRIQRRFGIRGSTKFMMTILSMVVFDGICKQLYPECDFQGEARPFLITARYRRKPAAKSSDARQGAATGVANFNATAVASRAPSRSPSNLSSPVEGYLTPALEKD